jgi:DNA topoisomerase-2
VALASEAGGWLSVCNNGPGVPVQLHKTEGCYAPELVFGHLLTGSNFDDAEERLTGGAHGYGAKLTNIFSTTFVVETVDELRRLHYRQAWSANMAARAEPEITPLDDWLARRPEAAEAWWHGTGGFTQVSFQPDAGRFRSGQQELAAGDTLAMAKRVHDLAGCLARRGVRVALDGVELPVESFEDYMALHGVSGAVARPGTRWEIGVARSPAGEFTQVEPSTPCRLGVEPPI